MHFYRDSHANDSDTWFVSRLDRLSFVVTGPSGVGQCMYNISIYNDSVPYNLLNFTVACIFRLKNNKCIIYHRLNEWITKILNRGRPYIYIPSLE